MDREPGAATTGPADSSLKAFRQTCTQYTHQVTASAMHQALKEAASIEGLCKISRASYRVENMV